MSRQGERSQPDQQNEVKSFTTWRQFCNFFSNKSPGYSLEKLKALSKKLDSQDVFKRQELKELYYDLYLLTDAKCDVSEIMKVLDKILNQNIKRYNRVFQQEVGCPIDKCKAGEDHVDSFFALGFHQPWIDGLLPQFNIIFKLHQNLNQPIQVIDLVENYLTQLRKITHVSESDLLNPIAHRKKLDDMCNKPLLEGGVFDERMKPKNLLIILDILVELNKYHADKMVSEFQGQSFFTGADSKPTPKKRAAVSAKQASEAAAAASIAGPGQR